MAIGMKFWIDDVRPVLTGEVAKEEYIKIVDIIEHAKEFKTYFDPMYRPVIDAFVYSLNNLPRK